MPRLREKFGELREKGRGLMTTSPWGTDIKTSEDLVRALTEQWISWAGDTFSDPMPTAPPSGGHRQTLRSGINTDDAFALVERLRAGT